MIIFADLDDVFFSDDSDEEEGENNKNINTETGEEEIKQKS